jgi:thiamine kinase-like enzyme
VALARTVAAWRDERALTVTPLSGGITNRNYRVETPAGVWVMRVAGERTEVLGIDRANEAEAATRAAQLGIGPPVLGPLPGHTTLITELVPGHHADGPTDFVAGDRLEQVVAVLQRFHGSGPIAGRFPIFRIVEWHARDAAVHGVQPPPVYDWLQERSARIEAAFATNPDPEVPCHNDLLPANVLFDGERVWLLDYEYAGMNDVFFDLGNLSVNSAFDADSDERLLCAYFGTVLDRHRGRLALMRIMSEFREGMWGVVQQAISTLDTIDFVAYANERLGNCRALCESSVFERWLAQAAEPAH